MNAKLQEYLNLLATVNGGNEFRNNLQRAILLLDTLYNRYEKQLIDTNTEASQSNSEIWAKLEECCDACGQQLTITDVFSDPEASGGLNDILSASKELSNLLKSIRPVTDAYPYIEETLNRDEIEALVTPILNIRHITVEELKLGHTDLSIQSVSIDDVYRMILDIYVDYPAYTQDYCKCVIGLVSSLDHLAVDPGTLSPINSQSSMTVDTMYRLDPMSSPIRLKLSYTSFQGANYLIFGVPADISHSYEWSNTESTGYVKIKADRGGGL